MPNTATEIKPEETEIDRAAIAAEVESETETNLSNDRASIAAEVEAETEINPVRESSKITPVDEKVEKPEKTDRQKVSDEKQERKIDEKKAVVEPALQDTIDNLSYRLKQAESRVGSLQNQLSAERKANKETATVKPKDAPTKEQIEEASKDTEDWEELKTEFPLWGKAIEKRIAAANADFKNKIDLTGQETAKLGSKIEKVQADFDRKLELTTLSFYHPNWQETVKSDAYLKWLPTQPEHIQAKHGSPSAADAIEVLNRFNDANNKPSKTPAQIVADRRKRLKQSKGIESTHKEKPAKSETDMSEDELRRKIASEVLDE